jgi:hypothetical protein
LIVIQIERDARIVIQIERDASTFLATFLKNQTVAGSWLGSGNTPQATETRRLERLPPFVAARVGTVAEWSPAKTFLSWRLFDLTCYLP